MIVSPFVSAVTKAEARRRQLPFSPDYGPLTAVKDERTGLPLLSLPKGFRYVSFGWTDDPLKDGSPTPSAHDGMAVVQASKNRVVLVRNHEIRSDAGVFSPHAPVYDPQGAGGTTNIAFDTRSGQFVKAWASLTGTIYELRRRTHAVGLLVDVRRGHSRRLGSRLPSPAPGRKACSEKPRWRKSHKTASHRDRQVDDSGRRDVPGLRLLA